MVRIRKEIKLLQKFGKTEIQMFVANRTGIYVQCTISLVMNQIRITFTENRTVTISPQTEILVRWFCVVFNSPTKTCQTLDTLSISNVGVA